MTFINTKSIHMNRKEKTKMEESKVKTLQNKIVTFRIPYDQYQAYKKVCKIKGQTMSAAHKSAVIDTINSLPLAFAE